MPRLAPHKERMFSKTSVFCYLTGMNIEQIQRLHRKHATSDTAYDFIYIHCQAVADIARQLINSNNLKVDEELIQTGALLHDIGAYKFIDADGNFDSEYICHGVEGYKILKAEGLPETLCRIAERHTGVGLTKEHIVESNLPLPHRDLIAETLEEELIMYADKYHSKPPRFNSFESYRVHAQRFGKDNVLKFEAFAKKFGVPNLQPLSKKYGHPIA